jgi:hypothetical protein
VILINLRTSSCLNQKKVLNMSAKKNSKRDIPPWEDSPYNTFDKPLPPEPPGWSNCDSSRPVKKKRSDKARHQARAFLGSHGCYTSRIRDDHHLNYLLSLCFGVSIDWNAKAKSELIRAIREIADMGRKARRRRVRAAQKSGHPAIRQIWDPERMTQ